MWKKTQSTRNAVMRASGGLLVKWVALGACVISATLGIEYYKRHSAPASLEEWNQKTPLRHLPEDSPHTRLASSEHTDRR